MRRPTIVDVAKHAGVSKSTVSLVLQGSALVKADTHDQVRKSMAEIGYVYNRSAAKLRNANTGLIGLVINDLRNPFFTEFAASLQMALSEQNYGVVLANTAEDPGLQGRMLKAFIEHDVAAFIISPAYDETGHALDAIRKAHTPALQVFRKIDGKTDDFPFLAPDYEEGSRLATQHLLDQGCRRIAFIGGLEQRPVTHERMSGYLAVLADAGIEPVVMTGQATRAFGRQAAHELHDAHPGVDGALCFNDLVALGMISGCGETGLTVGRDIRLVGIDDIEDCVSSVPSLSSVRCGIPELAETVAAQILAWLSDGKKPAAEQRTPVSLIVRESSGA